MKLELYNVWAPSAPNDSQSEFVASDDLRVFWLSSLNTKASPITLAVLAKIGQLIKEALRATPLNSNPEELLLALGSAINNKIDTLIKPLAQDKLELLVGACDQSNLVFSHRGNFYLLFQDQEKLFVYPTGEPKPTSKFLTELESTDISRMEKIFFATSGFKSSLPIKKFQDYYLRNGSKPLPDLIRDSHPNEILKFSCLAFQDETVGAGAATIIKPAVSSEPQAGRKPLKIIKKYFGWLINKILKIREYLTPKALEDGIKNFQALNKRTKMVVILLVLVSTAMISAMSHYFITSVETKKLKNASDQMTKIMAVKNAVKDNLSQGDIAGAKEKIKLTLTQLLELNNDRIIDEPTYQSLKNLIQDEWFKINKITEADASAVLFNFDTVLKDEDNKTVLSLVAANNKVYAVTVDAIYEIILSDKMIKKVFDLQLSGAAAGWRKCAGDGSLIYCLNGNNKIREFNLSDNKNRELTLSQTAAVTDFAVYEKRLYVLAASDRQIYRYDLSQESPLKNETWLKDVNVDLADGLTITVDGFVYVAKANGEIAKFSRGQKTAWQAADDVDPPLAKNLSAQTKPGLNSLFLLEPDNKRLVYVNKENGSLLGQLYSENFNAAKSFCLSGDKAYLLVNQNLYAMTY